MSLLLVDQTCEPLRPLCTLDALLLPPEESVNEAQRPVGRIVWRDRIRIAAFSKKKVNHKVIIARWRGRVLGCQVSDRGEGMKFPNRGSRMVDVEVGKRRSTGAAGQSGPRKRGTHAAWSQSKPGLAWFGRLTNTSHFRWW